MIRVCKVAWCLSTFETFGVTLRDKGHQISRKKQAITVREHCCERGLITEHQTTSQTPTMAMQETPFRKIVWLALAIVLNWVLFAHPYLDLTSCEFVKCR